MRLPVLVLATLAVAVSTGCQSVGTSERKPLETYTSKGVVLYIGSIDDQRPGLQSHGDDADAALSLVRQREILIPVSEVRSVIAETLFQSRLFEKVRCPPESFVPDSPDTMIAQAQQSSDYLLVGDLSQFHIKSIGFNSRATLSIPLDLLFAPLTFATYLTTGGSLYLFSGGLFASWTAEVLLTMSVSLVDVSSGQVAHTFRLEEVVSSPYDGTDAFGSLWDESDDWVDLGRRLGQTALHNAAVGLAARLNEELNSVVRPDRAAKSSDDPTRRRR